jgi:5-methylcytosine-specific restriction endonuclease McrA
VKLTDLSDDELVTRLAEICLQAHRLTARMIVHLIEVEERRLDLKAACTSMFDFCVRRLGMSEGAAYRRITAARLVRRFPTLLARIERGELHLSALVLLRPHLSEANVDALVTAVKGKSQREIEEILARFAPKPDVPSTIRKLPDPAPDAAPRPSVTTADARAAHDVARPLRIEPLAEGRYKVQLTASAALREKLERARDLMMHRNPTGDLAIVVERALDALLEKLERERLAKATRRPHAHHASVDAHDPARAVDDERLATTSPRPHEQERSARAHDPARAVDDERLATTSRRPHEQERSARTCELPRAAETERLAKATRPPPSTKGLMSTREIPRAVRREVFARDGEQCTFVDGEGRRCPSRAFLELDHVASRALGGGHDATNLRVRCRAHNRLHAEEVFGKAHVARRVDLRRRKSSIVVDAEPGVGSSALELALHGLVNLGFATHVARRAIAQVSLRHAGDVTPPPVPELVREALAALT